MFDSLSDTFLNAFTRVRKPDERFLSMREGVDKFEEGVTQSERLWSRVRNRTNGEYGRKHPRTWYLRLNEMAEPNLVKT